MQTVPSLPPEARREPSALHATDKTASLCALQDVKEGGSASGPSENAQIRNRAIRCRRRRGTVHPDSMRDPECPLAHLPVDRTRRRFSEVTMSPFSSPAASSGSPWFRQARHRTFFCVASRNGCCLAGRRDERDRASCCRHGKLAARLECQGGRLPRAKGSSRHGSSGDHRSIRWRSLGVGAH